jgi:hypothetical protein
LSFSCFSAACGGELAVIISFSAVDPCQGFPKMLHFWGRQSQPVSNRERQNLYSQLHVKEKAQPNVACSERKKALVVRFSKSPMQYSHIKQESRLPMNPKPI